MCKGFDREEEGNTRPYTTTLLFLPEQFTNEDEEKKIGGNSMGMKPTGQSAVIMIDQYLAKFPSTK